MLKHKSWLTGIVAVAALFSGAAYAGTVTNPNLSGIVTITDGGTSTWNLPSTYSTNSDGTFTYANSMSNSTWGFVWNITVNPDPFIDATFTIVNNTGVIKHFDLLFTLPVGSPIPSPTQESGSLSASFQDLNNSGSASLNNIVWNGTIDGSNAMSLFSGGFTCGGAGCMFNLGTFSDGPLPSGAVNTNIGTHLSFDLTAGDQASFTSHFEVTPVPLPAAVWLFGSGLLGLGALARRRET